VRLFHGLQLVKWVLEVLKEHSAAQMAAETVVKVLKQDLKKVKVYVRVQETDVSLPSDFWWN
jgi:hypothetical protein